MSYKRMKEVEPELAARVEQWLDQSAKTDEHEDDEHGDRRGDEIPPDLGERLGRQLKKIRESMARIEADAKAKADQLTAEREAKEKEQGHPLGGRKPKALDGIPEDGVPEDRAQSNFTDPESRIMKTGEGFQQCDNAQAAVDAESQVIVGCSLNNLQNDYDELEPMVEQIEATFGEAPRELSADAGYCSEHNLEVLDDHGVRGYVATGRQKHRSANATGDEQPTGPRTKAMRKRLRQGGRRSRYRLRKHTVEPVFGRPGVLRSGECRSLRRFFHRGLEKVSAEWTMLCTAHNLLKLAGSRA